jgi:hypothetical protein
VLWRALEKVYRSHKQRVFALIREAVRDRTLPTERELFLYEEGRREFEERAERVYEEYNRVEAQRESHECWTRIGMMEQEIMRVKEASAKKG